MTETLSQYTYRRQHQEAGPTPAQRKLLTAVHSGSELKIVKKPLLNRVNEDSFYTDLTLDGKVIQYNVCRACKRFGWLIYNLETCTYSITKAGLTALEK
jgi:hypothetical protein